VTATTTLVSMATNSTLENVSLLLTSSAPSGTPTFKGVNFPATSTNASAQIKDVNITMSISGSTDFTAYGIVNAGTASTTSDIIQVHNCSVYVSSTSTGTGSQCIGVWASAAGDFDIHYSTIYAAQSNSSTDCYGVYIDTGASTYINASTINGTNSGYSSNGYDIRTVGSLTLNNTRLVNSTVYNGASANSFTSATSPSMFNLSGTSTVTIGTRYMAIGTQPATITYAEAATQITMPQACVVKSLRANLVASPGAGKIASFTLRKNGIDSSLTATISGTGASASDLTHAITFAEGDALSMKFVTDSSATGGIMVSTELY